jgi:hypothetical protein
VSDLERKLGDALADGKIDEEDAHAVRTFALFLSESGPPGVKHDAAWQRRWLCYGAGLADGPTTDAEFAELRPRLVEELRRRDVSGEAP